MICCVSLAAFLMYAVSVMAAVFILVVRVIPEYGQTHVMVYIMVCSLVGSLSVRFQLSAIMWSVFFILLNFLFFIFGLLTLHSPLFWQVMSVKAVGIALKLTFEGMNQLIYPQTWAFALVVCVCVVTQMNYLNKVIHF